MPRGTDPSRDDRQCDPEVPAREAREAYLRNDLPEAERLLRLAITLDNAQSKYRANLGAVLQAKGDLDGARAVLEDALKHDPDHVEANDNLGVVLAALGMLDEALNHHRRAIDLRPGFARAHCNLGLVLERLQRRPESEAAFREALRLEPSMAGAWCGLGRALVEEPEKAEDAFRKALKLEPRRLATLVGLAHFLRDTHRPAESIRLLRRAVRLSPGDVGARLQLAQSLSTAARDSEALAIYRKLEKAGVSGPVLWFGLAICHANLGRPARADHWFRKALARDPDNRAMRSGYLFMLAASCLKSRSASLRALRQWERHPGPPEQTFPRRPRGKPGRPLRIGYLSPDFRQHVVRQFFEPVLWHHGSDMEVYCYSEAHRPDFATMLLRWGADRWFRTHGLADREVARQIHRDRIDILVDLAGHTGHNRLGVMTYRPAPVQATYLGYFGSTGLSAVDYWISDDVLHPPNTDEPASETIYRLPRCAYAYGAPANAPEVRPRNSDAPVTFGCFNNASKTGIGVMDTWTEILSRCPQSRLVLKDRRFAHGAARQAWKKRFIRRGIDPARVELLGSSRHAEYMAAYNEIDIALDPFPRTGGTTTCDALWMAVPTVTLAGTRYVTRLSATKLTAAGAGELITHSREAYIEKAVALAQDPSARRRYHETLRSRVARGPLGDPASLAKALECAYRDMLDRFRAAPVPDGL